MPSKSYRTHNIHPRANSVILAALSRAGYVIAPRTVNGLALPLVIRKHAS